MAPLGAFHLALAVIALAAGPLIFVLEKGTRLHIVIGRTYVVSMVGLNLTAFFIYRLFGGFGPFHVFALMSLASVLAGFAAAYFKRPPKEWLRHHYRAMSWSYVGLLAAAAAEAVVRIPFLRSLGGGWVSFWVLVLVPTFAICFVGGYLISTREERTIGKFSAADPRPSVDM
jgi:uncharacterized membrane protein